MIGGMRGRCGNKLSPFLGAGRGSGWKRTKNKPQITEEKQKEKENEIVSLPRVEENLKGRDLEGFGTPTVHTNCLRKRLALSALLEANDWPSALWISPHWASGSRTRNGISFPPSKASRQDAVSYTAISLVLWLNPNAWSRRSMQPRRFPTHTSRLYFYTPAPLRLELSRTDSQYSISLAKRTLLF